MLSVFAFILGYILDLIFGDPYNFPHIIKGIGNIIYTSENIMRKLCEKKLCSEKVAGAIMSVGIIVLTTTTSIVIINLTYSINLFLGFIVESFIYYQLLATKSLKDESMKVYNALKEKDLIKSRYMVSMIVGRDTQNLDEEGVTKAAVETVAENTSDGIIGPMFYMIVGGVPLAVAYKTINTLDSMIGYKNDKYINFGRFAAKLDDVASYIPARLSAYLMIVAAYVLNLDAKEAYSIYNRDKYNHASPNSAHTEAVAAGALGVQLAGDTYYFGKLYQKPTIGDKRRNIETEDIVLVNKLLYVSSFLCFMLGTISMIIISYLK